MQCLKNGDSFGLTFIKVLDVTSRGLVDEDEEVYEATDRSYWETRKGSPKTVALADQMLAMLKNLVPGIELKYNKFYIGLVKNGSANNFIVFRPTKSFMKMEPRIKKSEEFETKIESSGLDLMEYDSRWGRYRIRLTQEDISKKKEILNEILIWALKENEAGWKGND